MVIGIFIATVGIWIAFLGARHRHVARCHQVTTQHVHEHDPSRPKVGDDKTSAGESETAMITSLVYLRPVNVAAVRVRGPYSTSAGAGLGPHGRLAADERCNVRRHTQIWLVAR